jgi:hypothetical protein
MCFVLFLFLLFVFNGLVCIPAPCTSVKPMGFSVFLLGFKLGWFNFSFYPLSKPLIPCFIYISLIVLFIVFISDDQVEGKEGDGWGCGYGSEWDLGFFIYVNCFAMRGEFG